MGYQSFRGWRPAVINNYRDWKGFSSGGTLRALILDFAEFIRTGKYTNGNNGYGGMHHELHGK